VEYEQYGESQSTGQVNALSCQKEIRPSPIGFIEAPDCQLTKVIRSDGLRDAIGEMDQESGY
jgi:hypothetical protein